MCIHIYIYAYAHTYMYIYIYISIAYAHPVASVKQMCTLMFTTSVQLKHLRMHGAQQHLRMHADRVWTRACAHIQQCSSFLAMEAIANLSWVLREHRAGCRVPLALLPPALLVPICQLTLFAKNPSKSTLAHDTVAATVLHEHHPIIRVGAGLIQFVYWSHSRWATGVISKKNLFLPFFRANFL